MNRKAVYAGLLLMAMAPSDGHAQAVRAADLQGAWLEQSSECKDVFEAHKGALRFRRPVDAFAPAFIVSGRRLFTPLAGCRVATSAVAGAQITLTLSCANAVSTEAVRVVLDASKPGVLVRQMGADLRAGTVYRLCQP
jgi:hypothetical protein